MIFFNILLSVYISYVEIYILIDLFLFPVTLTQHRRFTLTSHAQLNLTFTLVYVKSHTYSSHSHTRPLMCTRSSVTSHVYTVVHYCLFAFQYFTSSYMYTWFTLASNTRFTQFLLHPVHSYPSRTVHHTADLPCLDLGSRTDMCILQTLWGIVRIHNIL